MKKTKIVTVVITVIIASLALLIGYNVIGSQETASSNTGNVLPSIAQFMVIV